MIKLQNRKSKISIIIPSFNQGKFIEQTIISILNQNYPNVEIIIFDGGSQDNTLKILEKYKNQISHLSIGKDTGQADAIKRGFNIAKGEILYWINSDDVLCKDTLKIINEKYLKTNKPSVFYGNLEIINENSEYLFTKYLTPLPFLLGKYSINRGLFGFYQPSFFMTASAYLLTSGVNPDLFFCMDNDLFKKLSSLDINFNFIDKSLSKFRIHKESKSSNYQNKSKLERKEIFGNYTFKDKLIRLYVLTFRGIYYLLTLRILRVIQSKYKLPWLP